MKPVPAQLSPAAEADLDELAVLLRHAAHGCRAFALYNTAAVRDGVVAALRERLAPLPVFEYTLTPAQPNPLVYLEQLPPAAQTGRAVVIFFDLERAGATAFSVLENEREAFADHPHGLVFWVTPGGRVQTARQATNFWAQRNGVFDFTLPLETTARDLRGMWVGAKVQVTGPGDLERQLRLFTNLLDEYPPTDMAPRAELHGKLAYLYDLKGQTAEAIEHLQTQLALAEQLNDKRMQAQALNNLGEIEGQQKGPTWAMGYYDRALALASEDTLTRGTTLVKMAEALYFQSDYGPAEQLLQDALSLYKNCQDQSGQAETYKWLGIVVEAHSDYAQAQQYYDASWQAFQAEGDQRGSAFIQQQLAYLAELRGDYTESERLYRLSLQTREELGDKRGLANVQHGLAHLAELRGGYAEAERLYQVSLQTFNELGEKRGMAIAQHSLAALAELRGDYAEAERLYRISLQTSEELGNKHGVATSQRSLAAFAELRGDYAEAERLYRTSLQTSEELGNKRGVAATQHSLAALAELHGDYAEAERLYRISLQIREELGDKSGVAVTQHELAGLAHQRNDYAQADNWYRQAIHTYEALGAKYNLATSLYNFGYLRMAQGRVNDARQLLERARKLYRSLGADDQIVVSAIRMLNLPRHQLLAMARKIKPGEPPRITHAPEMDAPDGASNK